MIVLQETEHYKIYWYDDNKDIIVGEVYAGWTWDSANKGLAFLNDRLAEPSKEYPTYAILHLTTGAQLMPRGHSTLLSLRELLNQDPGHEEFTIYVTEVNVLNTLMKLVSRLYGLTDKVAHHYFVSKFDDAITIIHEHKTQKQES